MSKSDLPFFDTSDFRYTQPPHPSWTYGEPVSTTEQGQKWAEEAEQGWKTINPSEEDPKLTYRFMHLRWFSQVSSNPCVISIACTSIQRDKDTAENIKATKGFTVNIISEPWIAQANSCAIDAPPGVSEWALSGLTKEPSVSVKPARVKESAFALECELLQNVEIKNAAGEVTSNLILGTVTRIHIRNAVLNEEKGVVDTAKLRPIGRLSGNSYVKIKDGFQIPQSTWAQDKEEIEEKLKSSL